MKFQKTISVLCVFVLFLQLFGPQFARAANSTGASDTGEVITTAESLSETGAEAGDTVDDTVIANDALSGSEEKTETNDATAETNDATAETNDATAETNDAMSVTSEDKTLTSGGGLLETHGNNMASVSTLSSNSIPQGSTITPTVRTKEKE